MIVVVEWKTQFDSHRRVVGRASGRRAVITVSHVFGWRLKTELLHNLFPAVFVTIFLAAEKHIVSGTVEDRVGIVCKRHCVSELSDTVRTSILREFDSSMIPVNLSLYGLIMLVTVIQKL